MTLKRMTIVLDEEGFRSVMGAILKTNADFTVETLPDEGSAQRKVPHSLRKKADDGRTPTEIVRDMIKAGSGKVHIDNLKEQSTTLGFGRETLRLAANRMVKSGQLKEDGQYFKLVVGGSL